MEEQWIDVRDKLPEIGQRVRVLVVKEMIYKGDLKDNQANWLYDGEGEHGIYSWTYKLKNE